MKKKLVLIFLCILLSVCMLSANSNTGNFDQSWGNSKSCNMGKNFKWVNTWVTMPQLTEQWNVPPEPFTQEDVIYPDTTLRQTVHVSIGSRCLRVRFSNAFSDAPITIDKVSIALPYNGEAGITAIIQGTEKALTFNGKESVTIPEGAQMVSDPVWFDLMPNSNLTITMYMEEGQATLNNTSHPGSRTTSYFVFGDHVSDLDLAGATGTNHWYVISGIEVLAPLNSYAVAIAGDSLTDGRGSTNNMNNRWPDVLSDRLREFPPTSFVAVLNQAAGGNRVLRDGLGPNLLARLDRDVLSQSGVKWLIVFEGVNDIGTADATEEAQDQVAEDLIAAFEQVITRAHAKNILVYGATITPFCQSFYADETGYKEAARQKVNNWIKTSGKFDGVLDFDAVVRDPENPSVLMEDVHDGDYLHLNTKGYEMLAESVPFDIFFRLY